MQFVSWLKMFMLYKEAILAVLKIFTEAYFSIGMLNSLLFFVLYENKILTIFCYWSPAPDNASPECNLTLSCAYFMAEVAMRIWKVYPLSFLDE